MNRFPWFGAATLLACNAILAAAPAFAAGSEIVVIVNPAAEAPSKDVIAEIYLGKSKAFTPVDLPEASATRTEFYAKATGREAAQVKATWARLVFTGKAQNPRELPNAEAVKKAVAADPKAMGYIEKSMLDSTVKAALTLN